MYLLSETFPGFISSQFLKANRIRFARFSVILTVSHMWERQGWNTNKGMPGEKISEHQEQREGAHRKRSMARALQEDSVPSRRSLGSDRDEVQETSNKDGGPRREFTSLCTCPQYTMLSVTSPSMSYPH